MTCIQAKTKLEIRQSLFFWKKGKDKSGERESSIFSQWEINAADESYQWTSLYTL